MSEAPQPRSRGRRVAVLSGLILAGVVALTVVFSKDILIAYHLRRLRSEEDYLLTAVTKATTTAEYTAVRRFIRRPEGKRSVYRHLIAQARLALNEQARVQKDIGGRTRYVVPVLTGTRAIQRMGATIGIDWFDPRVIAGRITVSGHEDDVRRMSVVVQVTGEEKDRRDYVELEEDASLASLVDLLLDDAFAAPGNIELQIHGAQVTFEIARPTIASPDPETIPILIWRPGAQDDPSLTTQSVTK